MSIDEQDFTNNFLRLKMDKESKNTVNPG